MRTTDADRGQRTLAGVTTAAGLSTIVGALAARNATGNYSYRVAGAKFIQAAQVAMSGGGTGFSLVQYAQPDTVNVFTYGPTSVAADQVHSISITAVPR